MSGTQLSPKQQFQQHCLQQAEQQTVPEFLQGFKQAGIHAFKQQELPSRQSENWKYLNLNPVWQTTLNLATSKIDKDTPEPIFAQLDSAIRIQFINAKTTQFKPINEVEFSACLFSQANTAQQKLIQQHLGSACSQAQSPQPFADLNQALLEDGLLIEIKAKQNLKKPIVIEHYNPTANTLIATRILIIGQQDSKARIIETFSATKNNLPNLSNSICEVICNSHALIEHNRLQLTDEQAMHTSAVHINLHQHSEYKGFHFTLGSQLTRNDLLVNHLQSGAHCQLNGVFLPENQQQIDFHSCIEHQVAHCTTTEIFRGIINDKATATFNGRIHIHPDAQKTDARLSNKNLLLTNQATINTKPELEIYADDVVCAHGATVAKIDEEAIFYLMSRGIPKTQAEILLSFGFINELLEELSDHTVAATLATLIANKFARRNQQSEASC